MTAIENVRLAYQSMLNLTNLRRDMRNNATAYMSLAQAQSASVADIAAQIQACAQNYLTRCGWQTTVKGDAVSGPKLLDGLTRFGMTQADLDSPTSEMQAAAQTLLTADVSSYTAIISATNAVLTSLPAYASVWPE